MRATLDAASDTNRGAAVRPVVFAAILMTIGLPGPSVTVSAAGSSAEEATAIPDTPVGHQLSWLLAALNAGKVLRTSVVSDHFAPRTPQRSTGIARTLAMASDAMAPATLAGLEGTATTNEIIAVVRGQAGSMHRLTLETDPFSEDRISDWAIRPLEPVKPGEVGGVIWSHRADAPMRGVDMELVDGTTGAAFTPAVRCRTDFAGYCRFPIPDRAASVAVKVTSALLWGRMDTYNFLPERAIGADLTTFDALPPNSLPFFAGRAGLAPDATKGHLYGVVAYVDAETGHFLAWAGCGEVDLMPAARVFYTKNPIDPDPSRHHTSPVVSAWWAFNLDPGPYTVTARVGGKTLSAPIAVLRPETFGFIWIPIAWDRTVPVPRCE